MVAGAAHSTLRFRVPAFTERLAVRPPHHRQIPFRSRHDHLRATPAVSQRPIQVPILFHYPVSRQGDMDKPKMLRQFHSVLRIPANNPCTYVVSVKPIPIPVEPPRNPLHPVPDVFGRIGEQPRCHPVLRKQTQVAREEKQKRFGAVVGLGLRLVTVKTFPLDPTRKLITEMLEMFHHCRAARRQKVRKPGQSVVCFILSPAVPARRGPCSGSAPARLPSPSEGRHNVRNRRAYAV